MKLRAPAIPLITCDPYFSVWAPHEKLNYKRTEHWTGKPHSIGGFVTVDGEQLCFLGKINSHGRIIKQTEMDIDALSTRYTFENEKIKLFVKFMTPILPDNLELVSRPVSYMEVSYESKDGGTHDVWVTVKVNEELCLNASGESPVDVEKRSFNGIAAVKMGNSVQNVLERDGDDLRINYGYFYLCVKDGVAEDTEIIPWRGKVIVASKELCDKKSALFLFAYDDMRSINYFGKHLTSYWNKDGKDIETAISEAAEEYEELSAKADEFSDKLFAECYMAGAEKYADICALSYRQAFAAHKIAVDENEEVLFISKECFSNGCAATVDVSYPSIPLFLRYNTELVKGMLRPIYKFAQSEEWKFDFAPHDAGVYPKVCGQVYGKKPDGEHPIDMQMPVEECGNMIIMETNIALADKNADFAKDHLGILKDWCKYLIKYGDDPENQLCTDDFAGHLAHNCNLALKAIMGIMGMSILLKMSNDEEGAKEYAEIAKQKADSWCKRARNLDGSYRLAFDKDGSYSMKYNMVWDKIWGTGLFDESVYENEISSNFEHMNEYGMPLDSRSDYTKADWLVWCASLAPTLSQFKRYIAPLWQAYNDTPDRCAMTDWYDTHSSCVVGFRHRSVVGGFYIKTLMELGILKA